MRQFDFVAGATESGERIDRVCAARLATAGVTRSQLERSFDAKFVRVAGRPVKPSYRVRGGDAIDVELPAAEAPSAEPEDIPLRIVFEDAHLMVVDKPAGLVVHPAKGHASGTLVNAVRFHADVADTADPLRPGIVHRLDKDTSGLLVVAKTALAREGLTALFKRHDIGRSYLAIVVGDPPERLDFDTLHGRHPRDRKRFSGRVREGRRAVTHVAVVERFAGGSATLVRCRLETGRTHQIRMHLSEGGYPILGDALYGSRSRHPHVRTIGDALGRQALHAERLSFVHPTTGQALTFDSAPPADIDAAIVALRGHADGPAGGMLPGDGKKSNRKSVAKR